MASWPQARNIPDKDLGKSAAGEALEGAFGRAEPSGYLVAHVDSEFCRGCGRCADICPEGAARLEETTRGVASCWIEPGLCTGCGSCIAECPTGAISIPEYEQGYFEKVINAFLG
jgi:ferredoxin